jgi:hypothetical protein
MSVPNKGKFDFLREGDWNTVCYQCGFKRKASYLVRNWQGYYVCPEHNEPRQPQDFVRGVPDVQQPPWTQPRPTATFTYNNTYLGVSDGINKTFQLGDGLYPTIVNSVYLDNVPTVAYTTNSKGLITLNTVVAKGTTVNASGVETA